MSLKFNRTSAQTISRADIGKVLYSQHPEASSMQTLGIIAGVKTIESSDGRDNWNQSGAIIEFESGIRTMEIKATDTIKYYLLSPDKPAPKPIPSVPQLRSTALRAANKIVGARLDFDLRPENPNGAAAIEIAEYEFDAAVLKLAKALQQ